MVLEADLVLCMRTMEVYLHCPWYFDFKRSVDGPVYQSCPSSLSSTSGHLLPFLLTMEQTKKAGLETGVSSHMVLHNIIRVRKEENMIRKAAKSSKGVMH